MVTSSVSLLKLVAVPETVTPPLAVTVKDTVPVTVTLPSKSLNCMVAVYVPAERPITGLTLQAVVVAPPASSPVEGSVPQVSVKFAAPAPVRVTQFSSIFSAPVPVFLIVM